MQRRENVAANPSSEASSFPLVDFISKWRLRDRRGQTAPAIEAASEAVATSEAAVNNQEPLLSRLAGTGKGYYKHCWVFSNSTRYHDPNAHPKLKEQTAQGRVPRRILSIPDDSKNIKYEI